jgi:hypothetical protein
MGFEPADYDFFETSDCGAMLKPPGLDDPPISSKR